MKDEKWVEFRVNCSFLATPSGESSRKFVFPTAPFYLSDKYNQKCIVYFLALGTDSPINSGDASVDVVFKGTQSSQFRLRHTWSNQTNQAISTTEFVQTPLTATILTSGIAGGTTVNQGNFDPSGNHGIVCNALWGQACELELRETIDIGFQGEDNYKVRTGAVFMELVMRIAPYSEETHSCGCGK